MSEFVVVVARKDGDAMRTPFVLGAQVRSVYRRHVGAFMVNTVVHFFSLISQTSKSWPGTGRRLLVLLKVTISPAFLES